MRERGEKVRVLSEGRKGGERILIQTESVYSICSHIWQKIVCGRVWPCMVLMAVYGSV